MSPILYYMMLQWWRAFEPVKPADTAKMGQGNQQ